MRGDGTSGHTNYIHFSKYSSEHFGRLFSDVKSDNGLVYLLWVKVHHCDLSKYSTNLSMGRGELTQKTKEFEWWSKSVLSLASTFYFEKSLKVTIVDRR